MRLDFGPFHGDGDAVEENDHQDDMIKHPVCDDFVAHQSESAKKERMKEDTQTTVNAWLGRRGAARHMAGEPSAPSEQMSHHLSASSLAEPCAAGRAGHQ